MSDQLHVWRFTPVAEPDEPAWQGRAIVKRLEIIASSAGQAILAAARWDEAETGRDPSPFAQDKQDRRSGFDDEKLYRVDQLDLAPSGLRAGDVIFPAAPLPD